MTRLISKYLLPTLFVVANLSLVGCPGGGDKPKSSENTGQAPLTPFSPYIAVNENLSSSEPFSGYLAEFQAIRSLGANAVQLVAPWKQLNPAAGIYDLSLIDNPARGFQALRDMGYTHFYVNFSIIEISQRGLPPDISGLALNSPTVKQRFKEFFDQVEPYLHSGFKFVSLGNEVDAYFKNNPSEWVPYKELCEELRTYIKGKRPELLVGVTTTFHGAVDEYPAEVAALNENMDYVAFTYYPYDGAFVFRNPDTVFNDMDRAVTLASGKPVVFQEWGYATHADLNGSEERQRQFIENTFTAWKARGTETIPFISFFKYRDWNSDHCATAYGNAPPTTAFHKYLCSLGLMQNDRTPKLALQELIDQIAALAK